jgi:hypothetical protein
MSMPSPEACAVVEGSDPFRYPGPHLENGISVVLPPQAALCLFVPVE